MNQSPSWEGNISATSHENHSTSWNQQFHCSFTKALHLSSVHVLNHEIWCLWDCATWYISI